MLGKAYIAEQSEDFYTAWVADKSARNPGIRSVVRSQLLHIALTNPECWQQIERMKALKFLVGKPDANSNVFCSLPELPAAARDIELASIISRCPGVMEIVTGRLERWTSRESQVIAAGLYLTAHAKQIAANTKRVGLIKGAKFSDEMTSTALLNKALELMGYKPFKDGREGSGDRLNIYRLETKADVVAATQTQQEKYKGATKLFKEAMAVVRAQTRESINASARKVILSKAFAWITEEAGKQVVIAIEKVKKRHADQLKDQLSNLGDGCAKDSGTLVKKPNQLHIESSASTPFTSVVNALPMASTIPRMSTLF